VAAVSLGRPVLALLRVVVGAGLALVAFEPIARLYYDFPGVDEPGIGPVPAAGSQVRWCVEGCASSTWQAHGVRRTTPYQPVRPDVIVLGDSNTEALQVGDDEVYTARLERTLGGAQVLNLGRSGFSAADYLGLAERNKRLFEPRWTVITLKDEDFEGIERGSYDFARAGGTLTTKELPRAPMSRRFEFFRRHLALYSFAVFRWHQLAAAAQSEPPIFMAGSATPPPKPPVPVASVREILGALSQAYDGRVTFVFLARPSAAHEPPPSVELEFDAACAELAASCVNPRARFQPLVDSGTPPYGFSNSTPNSGHLNAVGHAALADALAQELGRLALL
jgi:hypothetical protein